MCILKCTTFVQYIVYIVNFTIQHVQCTVEASSPSDLTSLAAHLHTGDHTVLHCTALCGTALHCTALYGTALHCTALYGTALYSMLVRCNPHQYTVLYCTPLHFTELNCIVLHYTVGTALHGLLHGTVYSCTTLHCHALTCCTKDTTLHTSLPSELLPYPTQALSQYNRGDWSLDLWLCHTQQASPTFTVFIGTCWHSHRKECL